MFIQTEQTPNPDALKFIPDGTRLTAGERRWFASAEGSPLAARLFGIDGVQRVFIAPDFVTVTRAPDAPAWSELRYPAIEAIADHFASGEPAISEGGDGAGEAPAEDQVAAEHELEDRLLLGRVEPDPRLAHPVVEGSDEGIRVPRRGESVGQHADKSVPLAMG